MPDILIRGLTVKTIKRLKARAAASGRSLQKEAKSILEHTAAEKTLDELREEAKEFSKRFEGRHFTDSVKMIREDRNR
jgi:plasmid stability protein